MRRILSVGYNLLAGPGRRLVVRRRLPVRREQVLSAALDAIRSGEADDEERLAVIAEDLFYAWGNQSWSATPPYLCLVGREILRSTGPVLEYGSGVSTLLAAEMLARDGRRLVSCEHSLEWCRRMSDVLSARGLSNVELEHSLLDQYPYGEWYRLPKMLDLREVGLVLCDGPFIPTSNGRRGLGSAVMPLTLPGSVAVLDDSNHQLMQASIHHWVQQGVVVVAERSLRWRGTTIVSRVSQEAPAGAPKGH